MSSVEFDGNDVPKEILDQMMRNIQNQNELSPVKFHSKEEGDDWKSPVKIVDKNKFAEYKQYLVLIYFNEDFADQCGFETTFGVTTGRSAAYYYIRERLEQIDLNKSLVVLEGKKAFEENITVAQFLRHIRDEELVEDEEGYVVDDALEELAILSQDASDK